MKFIRLSKARFSERLFVGLIEIARIVDAVIYILSVSLITTEFAPNLIFSEFADRYEIWMIDI